MLLIGTSIRNISSSSALKRVNYNKKGEYDQKMPQTKDQPITPRGRGDRERRQPQHNLSFEETDFLFLRKIIAKQNKDSIQTHIQWMQQQTTKYLPITTTGNIPIISITDINCKKVN